MIHDAIVEVTCDGKNCRESTYIPLPAGVRNTYIAEDSQIEHQLEREEWIVCDGSHYCSRECQEE